MEGDARSPHGVEAAESVPDARYRLAVALEDPGPVEQLLRTALDIAHDNDGEILIVSVITKQRTSPFSLFTDEFIKREFSGGRRKILDRALSVADGSGVPIRGRLLVSHDVSRAIERAITQFDCDAVLFGWSDRRRSDTVFGRNVDRVITHAPCDILVEKIGSTANAVERVLLPVGAGPNTELAATVARAIALSNDARVDVLRLIPSGATNEERTAAEQLVETITRRLEPAVDFETVVQESDDIPAAIIEATSTRDVTVLGATERNWTQRLVVGSTPEKVGRNAKSTVIVAKRGGRLRSRISYWVRRFG